MEAPNNRNISKARTMVSIKKEKKSFTPLHNKTNYPLFTMPGEEYYWYPKESVLFSFAKKSPP